MQCNYTERIKMIYIDPPYNTGGSHFLYKDNYNNWIDFMRPRLELSRSLLRPDGCICISVDDNSLYQLKLLMDELYGGNNFISCLVVVSSPAGSQSSAHVSRLHSYCLVYRKSSLFKSYRACKTPQELDRLYPYLDDKGRYAYERLSARGAGSSIEECPALHFPVYYDTKTHSIYIDDKPCDTQEIIKIIPYCRKKERGRWLWSREKMRREKDRIVVRKVSSAYKLYYKKYMKDDRGSILQSIITSDIARSEIGTRELSDLMGERCFPYPKPVSFVKRLIEFGTTNGDIVLDFFAGSGTTGHAVIDLNRKSINQRSYILIQTNDLIDPKKHTRAYNFMKNEYGYKNPTIYDVMVERIKKVINQTKV